MTLVVDWSIRAEPVSLLDVCRMTGETQSRVKQLYRSGELGPPPDLSLHVVTIPLYHVAALFVLVEAAKQNIVWESAFEVLTVIAGATFIEFQLAEVKAGRCYQRGATPALNNQLWARLQSSHARQDLEERLPGGQIATKRFAVLGPSGWTTTDELVAASSSDGTTKMLDARAIAATMKSHLRGTFLATHIA